MMLVGNALESASIKASSYSSEKRAAPSAFNSSASHSFEIRGHADAGTRTLFRLRGHYRSSFDTKIRAYQPGYYSIQN